MADVTPSTLQNVLFTAVGEDSSGGTAPIQSGTVTLVAVAQDGAEIGFPAGYSVDTNTGDSFSVLLRTPDVADAVDAADVLVKMKGDADLTEAEIVVSSQVFAVKTVAAQAIVIRAGVSLVAKN